MKIIKFIISTILLLGLSFLLFLGIKTFTPEKYFLIFIPVFWIFYLALSWAIWRENIYTKEVDSTVNAYNAYSKYSRNLFFVKTITFIGYIILKFYADINRK